MLKSNVGFNHLTTDKAAGKLVILEKIFLLVNIFELTGI